MIHAAPTISSKRIRFWNSSKLPHPALFHDKRRPKIRRTNNAANPTMGTKEIKNQTYNRAPNAQPCVKSRAPSEGPRKNFARVCSAGSSTSRKPQLPHASFHSSTFALHERHVASIWSHYNPKPRDDRSGLRFPQRINSSGLRRLPFSNTSKCKCVPVERPVVPVLPSTSPAATSSPTSTKIFEKWP